MGLFQHKFPISCPSLWALGWFWRYVLRQVHFVSETMSYALYRTQLSQNFYAGTSTPTNYIRRDYRYVLRQYGEVIIKSDLESNGHVCQGCLSSVIHVLTLSQ